MWKGEKNGLPAQMPMLTALFKRYVMELCRNINGDCTADEFCRVEEEEEKGKGAAEMMVRDKYLLEKTSYNPLLSLANY